LWHPKHKLVAPKDFYLDQNTIPLNIVVPSTLLGEASKICEVVRKSLGTR
jgi:hypothetical protein